MPLPEDIKFEAELKRQSVSAAGAFISCVALLLSLGALPSAASGMGRWLCESAGDMASEGTALVVPLEGVAAASASRRRSTAIISASLRTASPNCMPVLPGGNRERRVVVVAGVGVEVTFGASLAVVVVLEVTSGARAIGGGWGSAVVVSARGALGGGVVGSITP